MKLKYLEVLKMGDKSFLQLYINTNLHIKTKLIVY